MIETGRRYENPKSGGTLTLVTHWDDTDGEVFELERVLPPRTGRAEAHRHPDCDQTFTVLEGQMQAALDGEKVMLGPDEKLHLPRGTVHTDPWNPGPERTVLHYRMTPAVPYMKAYCETMFARAIEGRLNGQDELPLLQVAVVLVQMAAQASAPHVYQRATLPLLATLGRWRGYRVVS